MAQHQHVDSAVIERRLRPIYDSLESGNTKKALQETEKVLKKNSQQQCARALKALALLRLGREEEGETIIEGLEKEKPSEESTLQVITFFYRETEQLEKICLLYAEAVKQIPGNEEMLSHLFMSYVRTNDFKSQQSAALQLYKVKPKIPYYFWAVISVVLQALRGPDSKDKTRSNLLLALAQRMIDKLIDENKLEAAQEIQLYLSILQAQGKYQLALAFLDTPLCKKLYPGVPVQERVDLMKRVDKWAEVNILMKELLLENLDRWDYYKEYLESVFILESKNDTTDGADFNFDLCHEFLCQLIEASNKERGPYLGRLELHWRMRTKNKDADELLGDFLELMVEYFRIFGDKPCCSNDLRTYLGHLEPHRRAGLASRLLQDCGISATTLPQSKEQMQKHICSLQISRVCCAHAALGTEHLSALYTAFSLHYEHGMNAFGINLLSTDLGPSDSYALLAAYVMNDLSIRSNSSERLVEALCLLNYLLCNSPSNFHAKLLCLQIYHFLGCGWGACKAYDSLEVKHIQLDSMGYLHCAHLPSIGMFSLAKLRYETTLKFFTSSYKDSVEYLAMSYKFGSFSKLQEFMDFRDRLSNSLHYSLTSVEALLLEIVCFCWTPSQNMTAYKNMNISPAEDRISWDEICDNRDMTVIVDWDPPKEPGEEDTPTVNVTEESFTQDKELLRLRSALLRLVAAAIDYAHSYGGNTGGNNEHEQILVTIKDLYSNHFARIRSLNYRKHTKKYLVNLLPSRLHTILLYPYEAIFTKVAEFLLALYSSGGNGCAVKESEELIENIKQVGQLACNRISEHNKAEDLIWERRVVQELIVCCIEILSLITFIISVSHDRLTVNISTVTQTRKNKKKSPVSSNNVNSASTVPADATTNHNSHTEQNNVIPETKIAAITDKDRHAIIATILKTLKLTLYGIDNALETWETPVVSQSLTESLASMSLNPKVEVLVNGTFREDHKYTVKELQIIVKDKIKMINKM